MTYSQLVLISVFCLFTFGLSLISLVWPEKMQQYALKHCTKYFFWPNPFLGWMKTRSYLIYLRVVGAVFLAAGLFVLLVALTSWWGNIHQRNCEKHIKEEIHPGVPAEIAEADLKKCGFKTTMDPAKETLYGDKVIEGSPVSERTQVLINLDSENRVATVRVTTGLIGP